jgi:hypothetical protein
MEYQLHLFNVQLRHSYVSRVECLVSTNTSADTAAAIFKSILKTATAMFAQTLVNAKNSTRLKSEREVTQ